MRTLKACFLTAMLTAAAIGSALAQELVETDETPASRREIGFGTNIILGQIFQSGYAPLDLMYRWGDDHSLYRVGISLANRSNTNFSSDLNITHRQIQFNTGLTLGKEWRTDIAKHWLINYGGDVVLHSFQQITSTKESHEEAQGVLREDIQGRVNTKLGAGLRPFFGIIFRINERLLLGTEASLLAGLERTSVVTKEYTEINGVESDQHHTAENKNNGWDLNLRTQPASNIFVYYRF